MSIGKQRRNFGTYLGANCNCGCGAGPYPLTPWHPAYVPDGIKSVVAMVPTNGFGEGWNTDGSLALAKTFTYYRKDASTTFSGTSFTQDGGNPVAAQFQGAFLYQQSSTQFTDFFLLNGSALQQKRTSASHVYTVVPAGIVLGIDPSTLPGAVVTTTTSIVGLIKTVTTHYFDYDDFFPYGFTVDFTRVDTYTLSERSRDFDTAAQLLLDAVDYYDSFAQFKLYDSPTILVQWTAAPASGPGYTTTYKLYRSITGSAGTYSLLHTGTDTSYTDTALVQGKDYFYKVTAIVNGSEGAASAIAGATTAVPDVLATYDAIVLPPAPVAATPGAVPVTVTAFFYNPQFAFGDFPAIGHDSGYHPVLLVFNGVIGPAVSQNVALVPAEASQYQVLAANREGAGFINATTVTDENTDSSQSWSFYKNLAFYMKTIGFLEGAAHYHSGTYGSGDPRSWSGDQHNFYFKPSIDATTGGVTHPAAGTTLDVTTSFPKLFPAWPDPAVTPLNGFGMGWGYFLTDQMEFTPASVPGTGELYYASNPLD